MRLPFGKRRGLVQEEAVQSRAAGPAPGRDGPQDGGGIRLASTGYGPTGRLRLALALGAGDKQSLLLHAGVGDESRPVSPVNG